MENVIPDDRTLVNNVDGHQERHATVPGLINLVSRMTGAEFQKSLVS